MSTQDNFFLTHNRVLRRICQIVFIACAIAMATLSGKLLYDIHALDVWYGELRHQVVDATRYQREVIISTNYNLMQNHSRMLRDLIDQRIKTEYGDDKTRLYNDYANYYTTNDLHNPLFNIFSDEAYKYIDAWFPLRDDVHVVVADREKILFASSRSENIRKAGDISPLLFNFSENEMLSVDTDTGTIISLKASEMAAHPEEFDGIYTINVSYIYDHEDVFGVGDVYPDGTLTDNNKLAIIVECRPFSAQALRAERVIDNNLTSIKEYQYANVIGQGIVGMAICAVVMVAFTILYFNLPGQKN